MKEGDFVTEGQFLLQIDPQNFEAAVQRAEAGLANSKAQLTQAQASLTQAQNNYRRSMEIRKSNPNLVSEEQLEQLKTAVDVNAALADASKHNAEQAEASVKDAKVSLAKTTIKAPMSGRVTRLVVQNGETIKEYLDDKPYPSFLLIGKINNKIIHLLVGQNKMDEFCVLITAYEPDEKFWSDNFKKKK